LHLFRRCDTGPIRFEGILVEPGALVWILSIPEFFEALELEVKTLR
jgi:hypothetical protein